jgi:hypothetical protein
MVAESLNIDNQFPANSSSLPKTKRIKMVHKKKQICCSKNSQSHINSISSPIVKNKSFTVFHQNIRGLTNNAKELLGSVLPKLPHVVCLTQHHCKEREIKTLSIDHYILGAKFCRQGLKHGGRGIFVHESLAFTNIDLHEFCMEQDIKTCAVKINLPTATIYVICIHRLPTGLFCMFHKRYRHYSKSV